MLLNSAKRCGIVYYNNMPLNAKQLEEIALRYQGITHKEIARRLKLSVSAIDKHFGKGGILEAEYIAYSESQTETIVNHAKERMRKEADNLSKIMMNTIALIIKQAEKQTDADKKIGYYKQAFYLAERILNRTGVYISKLEAQDDEPKKRLTYDELIIELRDRGIDPRTGVRIRARSLVADQVV